eukprot:37489-Pelagomonas_calceolata.AAC.1
MGNVKLYLRHECLWYYGIMPSPSWEAGLDNTDIGSDDSSRLAQHNLQIPAHASSRSTPPYLFARKFFKTPRLTSSRPDAILITPSGG